MSFDPELMYAPLTAAWPERGLEESTVGPVLAKTKGKDAERAMNPSNPAATNLLLLGDRTRLLMQRTTGTC